MMGGVITTIAMLAVTLILLGLALVVESKREKRNQAALGEIPRLTVRGQRI